MMKLKQNSKQATQTAGNPQGQDTGGEAKEQQ